MIGRLHEALLKISEAYTHYMKILQGHEDSQMFVSLNDQINSGTEKHKKKRATKDDVSLLNFDFYMVLEDGKLVVWSFNPSFTLKSLITDQKPRCVILASGTLVPFDTYESEFAMSFPQKLVNDHVIDKK